jgi:6-pyruvoyltetrahydropterin/6-carboxytetrahydropterin synthase
MRRVTKTYGHDLGFTATFRQHRATSHCRFIHGYALGFKLVFECGEDELDENGWVINFGGLKPIKAWLCEMFDHTYLVAKDDPMLPWYQALADPDGTHAKHALPLGEALIQLRVVERTGCEAFAKMVYDYVKHGLDHGHLGNTKARLVEVEVREHGANAASYIPDKPLVRQELRVAIDGNEAAEMIKAAAAEAVKLMRQEERRGRRI